MEVRVVGADSVVRRPGTTGDGIVDRQSHDGLEPMFEIQKDGMMIQDDQTC